MTPGRKRYFETIDGSFSKSDNVVGYCRRKEGIVTAEQLALHKCCEKFDGEMCRKLIPFCFEDKYYETNKDRLTGDAYRESLGKKR